MSATTPDSETVSVLARPGDVVGVRMPTPAEREALGIFASDVPILSVTRPGKTEELFSARLAEIMIGSPKDTIR
jgi:hypothetical protein